ncbi:LapA family protein [Leucobacter viscericola]|uniref:LapA family protein n=1 Tax=Leucobacter viscericola TaxID=2714935 RepID=A0A6G7XJD6_9MICO|nr:LapA family protein [Leucobacter viscericola]QIK64481.1 LapA family protein [Leucobacter viscericola]
MGTKDPSESRNSSSESNRSNTKAIVAILLAIATLAFVFSNVGEATLHFLFLRFTMPTWAWFLAVLLSGVVIGSLFPWFRPKKSRKS